MAIKKKILELEDHSYDMKDVKKFLTSHKKESATLVHGQVDIMDQFGNLLQSKSNIILLGGRRFTLEKLFNVQIPNKRVTLNSLFHVNESESADAVTFNAPLREKSVCLFGVGRGGSTLTFGDVNVPAEKEFNLYDMVPLRYVSIANDLSDAEKENYYLRVFYKNGEIVSDYANADYIAYYLKRFETKPSLVIKIGESEYIPNLEFDNLPTDWDELVERKDVDMYIQLQLKLTSEDIREFYIATESIENARINELGVYLGYQPEHNLWTDYLGIETFSKLCFNNEPLDDETKELNIIYKFFI